nr:MAG TPA: hypothetical protein [Bacteriophage sp.]
MSSSTYDKRMLIAMIICRIYDITGKRIDLIQRDERRRETKTEPKARAAQRAGLFAQLKILFERWFR